MSSADEISLYFSSKKIFHFFGQKKEDLPSLFHKRLEGLVCITALPKRCRERKWEVREG